MQPIGQQFSSHALILHPHQLLGAGHRSTVYEGRLRGEQTAVAIKKIGGSCTQKEWQTFKKDLLSCYRKASLHPHIVKVYGIFVNPTYPVTTLNETFADRPIEVSIITEMMHGGSLRKSLKTFNLQRTACITYQIANALAHLHSKDFPHDRLSSANVLLTKDGIAKIKGQGLRSIYAFFFRRESPLNLDVDWDDTQLYTFAPVLNYHMDIPSRKCLDVYALGTLIWEMFAKRLPYAHHAKQQFFFRAYLPDFKREVIPGNCPAPYAALIRSCWSEQTHHRPDAMRVAKIAKLLEVAFHLALMRQDAGSPFSLLGMQDICLRMCTLLRRSLRISSKRYRQLAITGVFEASRSNGA